MEGTFYEPSLARSPSNTKKRLIRRRLITASLIVVLLHLFFAVVVAPRLELNKANASRTEVIEISPQELAKIKEKVMKDKYLQPLLEQELHKELQTKEAPKDAHMMAPFNQTVPKEKIAGAQHDEPLKGGGSRNPSPARPKPQRLELSQLGLGTKVPPPPKPEELQGPQGPPSPRRPVGREDKNLEHGDDNLLNAVESEYYSFFARLEEPIIRNWFFLLRTNDIKIRQEMASHQIRAGAELPVTIEFVLDREGAFKSIDVIESSGIPTLDFATREAVRKLGSLPNPPPGLFEGGEYFTRRLRFMVHVTDAPMVNSRPDLYW